MPALVDLAEGRTTDFGDMYYVGLFSKKEPVQLDNGAKFVWGLGFDVGLPTAQEDVLGTGKWTVGPSALAVYLGWVTSQIHTPAQGFGKIMSAVKPRLAVAYHYWNHRDLELDMYQAVRETYDGPLAMAADMTVINLTRDHIEVREVTYNHEAWAQGTSREWDTAPRGEPATGVMSDWLKAGTVKEMIVPPKEPSE